MHLVAGMLIALSMPSAQQPEPVTVRLEAGEHARENVPIRVVVPAQRFGDVALLPHVEARVQGPQAEAIGVQVRRLRAGEPRIELAWIQPGLDRAQTVELRLTLHAEIFMGTRLPLDAAAGEGTRDLYLAGQPLLRYAHAYDPGRRDETYKVFHHIYDLDGTYRLTKGSGGMHSHHRGVFLGWNRTQHGDDSHDFWSCGGGETIRHRRHLELGDDPPAPITNVQGGEIEWLTADGRALVAERRIARAWRIDAGMHLFDFDVELRALEGPVELRGDAHHAGFQVRLDQGHTRDEEPAIDYLRPASAEDLGNDVWEGCDWVAACFPMHDQDHVLLHMDAPDNPRPIRYSTRPYGRFGSAFEAELGAEPLRLRYRLVLLDPEVHGASDRATCEQLYRDFADPVKVTVVE